MNRYLDFFRFDILAHQVSHVVHLGQLYEFREDTLNLQAAIGAAERGGVTAAAVKQSRAAFETASALIDSLPLVPVACSWGLSVATFDAQAGGALGWYRHCPPSDLPQERTP